MSYPFSVRMFVMTGITVLLFFMFGCSSSPPSRFYTLTSLNFPHQAGEIVGGDSSLIVRIGPVRIPDYLDRSEIVTRTPQNDLLLGEFDLWGGSLKNDVERVLVENLSSLLRGDGVSVTSWKNRVPGGIGVPVVLNRFDAVPGDTVTLLAQWSIVGKEGKAVAAVRESTVISPVKGSDYRSIVAAMSDALTQLSKEMAATLSSALAQEGQKKSQ